MADTLDASPLDVFAQFAQLALVHAVALHAVTHNAFAYNSFAPSFRNGVFAQPFSHESFAEPAQEFALPFERYVW
jgi:hypothetical protein